MPIPRWQQAFERDYSFSGSVSEAIPAPPSIQPYLEFARAHIDPRLNGILVNWYDGSLGHYIGPHRDSTKGLVIGAPIVTISLGEERVFRLTPYRQGASISSVDFLTENGTVFVMPYDTNLAWKHSVPRFVRYRKRRISVTIRAFDD